MEDWGCISSLLKMAVWAENVVKKTGESSAF